MCKNAKPGKRGLNFGNYKVQKQNFRTQKVTFLRAHLIPIWNRNVITACEEAVPGFEWPCSAEPKKIIARISVTLQRRVDKFRYGKSHVQTFSRQGEAYCCFTLALLWLWRGIYNTSMTSLLTDPATLLCLTRTSQTSGEVGGAALCRS